MKKILNIVQGVEDEINSIILEAKYPVHQVEDTINTILRHLATLRKYVQENGFKSEEDEIHFFKNVKPKVVSRLIFFNSVFKIETKRPNGGRKIIRKYLNAELHKLQRFFENNLEFYKYYRTNNTFLDRKFFLRGNADVKLNLDTFFFEADPTFSTSHDYKVAKIIANDMIQVYLEHQHDLNEKGTNILPSPASVNWTGSKTSLIELIYALHHSGTFDNGNVEIKVIAKAMENAFNIDLGDFYHTYLEIRNRKVNRTKFLDTLKDTMLSAMDEQDEK